MSQHAQRILIWWSVAFLAIYVLALAFLFDMVPPPRATMSAQQIADWYAHRHTRIVSVRRDLMDERVRASASVVVAVQLARVEGGRRVWSILTGASGVMTSIFLVLPPLFWGVAAYTPSRDPQVTAVMHELGMLTFVAVVPYFIFMWVAIAVFCFRKSKLPTRRSRAGSAGSTSSSR